MKRSVLIVCWCFIALSVKSQQGNGFLYLESDPPGASVFVDGNNTNQETPFQKELTAGKHILLLKLSTFPKYVDTIEIKSYETLKLYVNLKPEFGSVEVSSNPSGAHLLIDGKEVGLTPMKVDNLATGKHELVLRNETYNLLNQEFTIEAASTTQLHYELKAGHAQVSFSSFPKRARISIDNVFMGLAPSSFSLTSGNHLVNLEKKHFTTFSRDLEIREGTSSYNILLSPKTFRSKGNAILYSVFWPGAGQSYISRNKAYGLLGAVGYGLAAASVFSYLNLNRNYDNYVNQVDMEERSELKEKWQNNLTQTRMLTISTAAFWGVNLLWTSLMKSDKQRFERVKLKGDYLSQNKTGSLGLTYTF